MTTPPAGAPPRRVHVFVCVNAREAGGPLPSCARRGSAGLLEAFRAEAARRGHPSGLKVSGATCLTTCQCGPTVAVYPEGIWYGPVAPSDVPELLDAHLTGTGPVARLQVPAGTRVW